MHEQLSDFLEKKLDHLARKRDYAADVLGNKFLAMTYQQEIDEILRSVDAAAARNSMD